ARPGNGSPHEVPLGRQERRRRANPHRSRDAADARAGIAGPGSKGSKRERREMIRATSIAFVSLVSLVVAFSGTAFAQMTGAPNGYKQEPGMTSSQVPAALREIGFDQNLNQ